MGVFLCANKTKKGYYKAKISQIQLTIICMLIELIENAYHLHLTPAIVQSNNVWKRSLRR